MFRRVLAGAALDEELQGRANALGRDLSTLRIAIKPTFMLGYDRKDPSTITGPTLLDELVTFFRERGCTDVAVVENRNLYDRFFQSRSVGDVARYFELTKLDCPIVDLSEEQEPHAYGRGMAQYTVGRTWRDADFRISFGKLRSHPVDQVHLTTANLEGVGARCDEFLFSERQAHRDTSVMTLVSDFPPHFAIIDGYEHAPDGLAGVMGCRRPRQPQRFYAGRDAIAVDLVAARHTGLSDPKASPLLRTACHWFGDPTKAIEVIGVDEPLEDWSGPRRNELSAMLSVLAYPVYVAASGRGALFVPRMDESAFPPIRQPSIALRSGRWMMQTMLGL